MSLPASAYRPGDHVVGEDDGEKIFGTVAAHHGPVYAKDGDVVLRWNDEEYVGSHTGHIVSAELLRLWPAAAHAAREVEALNQSES